VPSRSFLILSAGSSPPSPLASDFALRATPRHVVAAAFFLRYASNEDWLGRDLSAGCLAEDLNAPEAHKHTGGA